MSTVTFLGKEVELAGETLCYTLQFINEIMAADGWTQEMREYLHSPTVWSKGAGRVSVHGRAVFSNINLDELLEWDYWDLSRFVSESEWGIRMTLAIEEGERMADE